MANIKKINDRWRIFFSFTLNKKEFIQREYSTKVVLALFTGTLTVFAIPIIIGWISGLYDPQDVVLVVSMSLFGGYGLWLCSRSRWQIASFIPPILTLLLAAYLTFLSGFLTTGLLIYPISILLSAVLQGKKQQWIMTGISFCIYLVVSLNRHPESYEYLVETILMVGGGFMGIALLNDFISNEWAKSHARLRDEAAEHLRSKQKLEKSEQQYRLLFENNLAGVYISSLDGQLISCNQAFANIFGFESPNEVIGQFVFNFYQDPKDREKFIALLTKHGYTKNIESRLLHKDGRIIWGIENSNLSEDPNNGGMIIHGTIIDITDLKEEQRLQDALRLIVLSTTRASDIDDLYREIHKIIREVMIADNFYIALYDEDDDLLRFPYLMDEGEDSVEPYKPDQGMTEYVLRNGKPLLCEIPLQEEIADQGEFEFVGASPQIWLGVPLTMEDNVIGVIAVQHYTDPKAYSLRDQYFLEFVSSQIAHAITHKQAEQALIQAYAEQEQRVKDRTQELQVHVEQVETLNLAMTNLLADIRANQEYLKKSQVELEQAHQLLQDERIHEQSTLLRLSQSLLAENDSQAIMDLSVSEAKKAIKAEFAAIALVVGKGNHFSALAKVGWAPKLFEDMKNIPIEDSTAMGRAILTKKTVITSLASEQNTTSAQFIQKTGIQASLIAPMLVGDQAIGGLALDSLTPRDWTKDEVRLLSLIANTTAQALERARLFAKVSEGRQRLHELSKRLVDVQENERRAVARELHDQIGQSLSAIKLKLQSSLDISPISEEFDYLINLTDETIQQVRDLSRDLLPAVLDDFGLEPAISWYVDRQTQWSNIEIKLAIDYPEKRLEREIEITAYRIIQGALSNAIQHSQAESVDLRVSTLEHELCIELSDSGIGFDVSEALFGAKQGKSLGLLNIIERAELVGGTADISASPEEGTLIEVRLPLALGQTIERRDKARDKKYSNQSLP